MAKEMTFGLDAAVVEKVMRGNAIELFGLRDRLPSGRGLRAAAVGDHYQLLDPQRRPDRRVGQPPAAGRRRRP